VRDAELLRLLAAPDERKTVGDLRAALESVPPGVRLADVSTIHPDYDAALSWSSAGLDRVDLVFRSRTDQSWDRCEPVTRPRPWSAYTNRPGRANLRNLGPELRTHLRTSLPEFMVPSAFVMLDALPRTPNGKVDRKALPEPDRGRAETSAVPEAATSDCERAIAGVWQGLLSLDTVGVETNLFDLGANSLMMVRAMARLTEALDRSVSLVEMFSFPTVRSLADHLESGDEDASAAMKQSHDRGQSRKAALQRRRESRGIVGTGRTR